MKRTCKKLALLGVLVVGSASATEMRTPWIAERGPIRYVFEKLHEDNKCNVNYWTALHAKEAHKAFLKHGIKAHPMSALIFNKADFRLNEIFPGSHINLNEENYSPWLNLVKIEPRVEYWEWGITMGGRWDCEVWKGKGRIGMRATVPFRSLKMERQDLDDEYEDPEEDFVASNLFKMSDDTQLVVKAYNLALVKGLPLNAAGDPYCVMGKLPGLPIAGSMTLSGSEQADDLFNEVPGNKQVGVSLVNNINPTIGVISSSQLPIGRKLAFEVSNALNLQVTPAQRQQMGLSATGQVTQVGFADPSKQKDQLTGVAFFNSNDSGEPGSNVDYTNLGNDQAALLNLWVTFARDVTNPDADKFANGVKTRADEIQARIDMYKEDPMKFFARKGYEMATSKRGMLGDVDVDLFYEHTFNKDWIGELFVGVRVPTGGDRDQFGNPYNVQPGNGEHWEVKTGGMIAYQPLSWLNMKLDAYYSFVLESTEHRMAAFKGAKIKNFGPRADADVDWGYFVGRLDFTFFHPKTSDIRTVLGYEFYYKTEDHLTYKKSTCESFAGRVWNTTTQAWVANPQHLDNGLARKHTESISHKLRGEISYQANKYFELYASCGTVFAGQNVFRDSDYQGGFLVRF